MDTRQSPEAAPEWLRRVSVWHPDRRPGPCGLHDVGAERGFPWFELACGADETAAVLATLGAHCPGLTEEMLDDLLTPDELPDGRPYGESIRLASTFGIEAERDETPVDRGVPKGVGVLRFQPVEIIAGDSWLISCWHPTRTFEGSTERDERGLPGSADGVFEGVAERWRHGHHGSAADLGIAVMQELALNYVPTQRTLMTWLEDWELSLYREDRRADEDQLTALWGLMAVMRNWLTPLNRPGLRSDVGRAWLATDDHAAVIDVDERVDRALAGLAGLSETLRQAFGLLHVQREERSAHRLETLAAVFLVPTLVVGFYGANTWVPGQNKHWGFWVMVGALVIFSCLTVAALRAQRQLAATVKRAAEVPVRLRRDTARG